MSTRWIQDLVNAEVEVSRAVFLMNVHFLALGKYKDHLEKESQSPGVVLKHIDLAIADLQKAKEGFNVKGR